MASPVEILCISINHGTTPLEVRERIAFRDDEVPAFLDQVVERAGLTEAALLSTCNRTELFSVYEADGDLDRTAVKLGILAEARDFVPSLSPPNYEVCRDSAAVRHLFRVAAGLESQILGESQILRQVRRAGELAQEHGTSGKLLQRLWQRAIRVGKRVRSETGLGQGTMSASYAGLELARKVFGTLKGRNVLVIGVGEVGLLTLENLRASGTGSTTIVNRNRGRAEEVAHRFDAAVWDFDGLDDAIIRADLIVSSTGSQEIIVDYERMRNLRHKRRGDRPLLIVDLAVPRDFDPRCGHLDQVFVKNLDDLQEVVDQNLNRRRSQLPFAESIVEIECSTYFEWLEIQAIEPMILALRERYEGIRSEELEKLRSKVDDDVFEELDRLTRRLINRILHSPTSNLRRHEGIRDEDVHRVVHEVLTQDIPHPRSNESDAPGE